MRNIAMIVVLVVAFIKLMDLTIDLWIDLKEDE